MGGAAEIAKLPRSIARMDAEGFIGDGGYGNSWHPMISDIERIRFLTRHIPPGRE
jgi:hypothetical protein